jgi:hypothetical protein
VALHELTLATMTTGPPIPIAGGVRRLEISATPRGLALRIDGDRAGGRFVIGAGNALVPAGISPAPALAVLTARGALPAPPVVTAGACQVAAREIKASQSGRAIVLSARGRIPRQIGETLGAGLVGLPIP